MNAINIKFIAILSALLTACGGGGGSSGGETVTDFPDVSGDYSLTTSRIDYVCSDNSVGSIPAISTNFSVTQNNSMLTVPPADPVPGFVMLDDPGLSGNVAMDRSFVMQKNARAYIEALDSNASVNYSLSGNFSSNGWSGAYEFTVVLDNLLVTCTYVSTFTGSRTASLASTAVYEDPVIHSGEYFYESPIYLDMSELGKGL